MSLVNFDGGFNARIGYTADVISGIPSAANVTLDAANEAVIFIGQMITSDGGSHTIDTTGSSSMNWRTAAVTFANAGTTVKVGIGAVDATNGPPGRAVNVADVITMDVSKSMTGGGGGVTATSWQTHVPDAGTKTIANNDMVAFCVQMTARAGADSVLFSAGTGPGAQLLIPSVTTFLAGAYSAASNHMPNIMVVFSDGARGWFYGSDVFSGITAQTWNSGSATKEYGQLFKIPAPLKIYGFYANMAAANDLDIVLYSDPLGTPVAERTVAIDANTLSATSGRRFNVLFASPYTTTADQLIGAVFKPGASNITAYRKTMGNAADRVSDLWGVDGYAISRATGAFADLNSGLDHFYIGLLVGAIDDGAGGGRSIKVNDGSVVA